MLGQKVRVNVESSENIPLDQVSIASTAANIETALDELESNVDTLVQAIRTGLTFNGTARAFEMLALLRTFEVGSDPALRSLYACFEGGEYFESSKDNGLTRSYHTTQSYNCDQEAWYRSARTEPSTFMNASLGAPGADGTTISVTQLVQDSSGITIGVVGAAAYADLVTHVLRDELAVTNDLDRVMYVVKDDEESELITTCQGWNRPDSSENPPVSSDSCRRWEQLEGDDAHTCQTRGQNMSLELQSDGLTGVRAEDCPSEVAEIAQFLPRRAYDKASNRSSFLVPAYSVRYARHVSRGPLRGRLHRDGDELAMRTLQR
jgi:hypothetical protein